MNYRQFQRILAHEVQDQSGGKYFARVHTLEKNNGVLRGALEISDYSSELYPSIYTEPYYSNYQDGMTIPQLANMVLEQCETYRAGEKLPPDFFSNYAEVKDRIFCKLINYEMNENLLKNVPHRKWKDLAVVCYYLVDPAVMPDASILIRQEHLVRWKITKEELYENAWHLTRKTADPVFRPLSDVLEEMGTIRMSGQEQESSQLYLLTNAAKTFGSVLITDPLIREWISNQMRGDYYILPSSIHECLILSADECWDENYLLRMVREINYTQVSPQEVLSDNIYYFERETEELSVRDGR